MPLMPLIAPPYAAMFAVFIACSNAPLMLIKMPLMFLQ